MPTEPLFQDPVKVELVRHRAWDKEAAIPGWVEFDQYQVWVHSDSLAYRNKDKKLMVGYIGIQPGANFMPSNEFNAFTYPHQQWIAEEAKKQHGQASPLPHENLPPHLSMDDIKEINEQATAE